MKREKGYALVLVLIIITFTMILGLALSTAALTTSKQFKKTDNHNKAIDLGEMGVTYYQAIIEKSIPEAKKKASDARIWCKSNKDICRQTVYNLVKPGDRTYKKSDLSTAELDAYEDLSFKNEISNLLSNFPSPDRVDPKNNDKFVLTNKEIDKSLDTIYVTIESKGLTDINDSATITANFTITRSSGDNNTFTPIDTTQNPLYKGFMEVKEDLLKKPNKPPYESSTYFSGNVDLRGGGSITVNGNAYFKKLTLRGTPSGITISGDAIFETGIVVNGNSSICIKGKTYTLDSKTKNLIDYIIPYNTCSKTGSGHTSTDWELDKNSIEVTY